MVLTCIAFLLMAILFEGLKCYREHLYKRMSFTVAAPTPKANVVQRTGSSVHGSTHNSFTNTTNVTSNAISLDSVKNSSIGFRVFSLPHFLQSILHVVQIGIGYVMMLGFMTFNYWICMSVLIGTGLGYFCFSWRKVAVVHVAEHCG